MAIAVGLGTLLVCVPLLWNEAIAVRPKSTVVDYRSVL